MSGRSVLPAVLLLATLPVSAGEISGLPPHLPPTTTPDYTFFLGNDFFAPGTNDDFRTQQIISTARFGQRWQAILDHSMLTRADAVLGPPARIDLMSLSVGYDVVHDRNRERSKSLTIGMGVRGVGNYEGSRIQNGFHSLISTGTSFLPYEDTRQTDATAWVQGERHEILRRATGDGWLSGWDTGYWARAGALATADGQFDAVAGLYAIASRPNLELWLGLRRDWREGYDADIVQVETAAEESKTALSYGVRWGSLVLETVHRFDSFASYGQISFVSSAATRKTPTERKARGDFQLGLHVPHMMLQVAGRWHTHFLTKPGSPWRESVLVDLRGGQPQIGRDAEKFSETAQLVAGLEFSRQLENTPDWLRIYASIAAGYRNEQFVGRGTLDGIRSESIGKAVLQTDVGVEIDATRIRNNWRHSLRFGITGWLPASQESLQTGNSITKLHEPGASITVIWAFNYH